MCRSSHQRCSIRKGGLKKFAKFTGKHLCQSLFLIKLQAIKKETGTGVFCEFCEIFKNTFFIEHVWTTVSECGMKVKKTTESIKFFLSVIFRH